MRRFTGEALGLKLKEVLAQPLIDRPTVDIYTAADNIIYRNRKILGGFPYPFNGMHITLRTYGPFGYMEFTWTKERRDALPGETPLSALEDPDM